MVPWNPQLNTRSGGTTGELQYSRTPPELGTKEGRRNTLTQGPDGTETLLLVPARRRVDTEGPATTPEQLTWTCTLGEMQGPRTLAGCPGSHRRSSRGGRPSFGPRPLRFNSHKGLGHKKRKQETHAVDRQLCEQWPNPWRRAEKTSDSALPRLQSRRRGSEVRELFSGEKENYTRARPPDAVQPEPFRLRRT